jgi:hypothetical protein
MMKAFFLALVLFLLPVQAWAAWGTPTFIGSDTTDSFSITTSASVPAGALIVVVVTQLTAATAVNGTMTDNAAGGANSYTVGASNIVDIVGVAWVRGIIFYAYNVNALASGKVITYTPTGGSVNSAMSAFYVTGEQTSSAPLDASVTAVASNIGNTQPTVTSGTPGVSGELFVGAVLQGIVGTLSFTQDAANGWAVPPNEADDTTSALAAGGNQINAGTGTKTFAPTLGSGTPSNGVVSLIVGFKVAAGGATPKPCFLGLMGVGTC